MTDEQKMTLAFKAMLRNKMLRASKIGREHLKGMGNWWYIQSVNADATITICSNTHTEYSNANIEWLAL
jgi:hypothetical protein